MCRLPRLLVPACVAVLVACGEPSSSGRNLPPPSGSTGGTGGSIAGSSGGTGGGGSVGTGGASGAGGSGRDAGPDAAVVPAPDASAVTDAPGPDARVDTGVASDAAAGTPDVAGTPDAARSDAAPDAAVADAAGPEVKVDLAPALDTAVVNVDAMLDAATSASDSATSAFCTPSGSKPALKKTLVGAGLAYPVDVAGPPGEPDTLWVLEHRSGRVRVVRNGGVIGTLVQVVVPGIIANRGAEEEGLYSIAFHPSYASNKLFYLFYSSATAPDYSTTVDEFRKNSGDTATFVRNVYSRPSNHFNHNGGAIAFNPLDNELYISIGDNLGPTAHMEAQKQEGDWGRVLRIDRDTKVGTTFHYGLRNPWRISFDRLNGDLYIGDVGETGDFTEALYYVKAGAPKTNHGWCCTSSPPRLDNANSNTPIIGGIVYRGTKMPGLCGYVVYGRHGGGFIKTLKVVNGAQTDRSESAVSTSKLSSLGADAAGELYFTEHTDGEVFRIDPQ